MATAPSPVSRYLRVAAFVAVASSASVQWVGVSAQKEAVRQQVSRHSLAEFSNVLHRYDVAPEGEKGKVAESMVGLAERMSQQARGEKAASASRRVLALASYEDGKEAREKELAERLRAEVRGMAAEAESLESAALSRATMFGTINQALLFAAAILCGWVMFRGRRGTPVRG